MLTSALGSFTWMLLTADPREVDGRQSRRLGGIEALGAVVGGGWGRESTLLGGAAGGGGGGWFGAPYPCAGFDLVIHRSIGEDSHDERYCIACPRNLMVTCQYKTIIH